MRSSLLHAKRVVSTSLDSLTGIIIASTLLFLWLSSLIFLLVIDISQIPSFWVVSTVLLRAFLQTGVFIIAHDAIHGTIFPKNRQINDFIGFIAARMYVFLSYKTLSRNHLLHHRYPASNQDPDFCEHRQKNSFIWYVTFMTRYLKGRQTWVVLIGINIVFYSLLLGLHIPMLNLLLFWLFPISLSSIQLFYFGIYLPHRQPKGGYKNRHRAESLRYPVFWSFLACYHFGYHWEHHEYPHLPWYKLPSVVKKIR